MSGMGDYDYRNCSSLFGYAAEVHERSGAVCQLCGAGGAHLDFDLWRQLTVEHLIGSSQGGYLAQIRAVLTERFPDMPDSELKELATRVDRANTITACGFCNSTTSRDQSPVSMAAAIANAPDGSPDEIYSAITADLVAILETKRAAVAWKLSSVRKAFDTLIEPKLKAARSEVESPPADTGS